MQKEHVWQQFKSSQFYPSVENKMEALLQDMFFKGYFMASKEMGKALTMLEKIKTEIELED